MQLKETDILSILNENRQFVLPIYQRRYSWEEEHCATLWDDIVRMIRNGRRNHFIGSIVDINDDPMNEKIFTLIDGQQRIATLILLLVALRDYALNNKNSGIDAAEIENNHLKNNAANLEYKLILTGDDKNALIKLIDKNFNFDAYQSNDDDEKVLPRLAENYKFFKNKLEAKNQIFTPRQVYDALRKIKIVDITLGLEDDPQVIFESLNSSGKDLSQSDLIRSFVLMRLAPQNRDEIYRRYWAPMERLFGTGENNSKLMDNFFRDYLTMRLVKIPKEDRIYVDFKNWYNNAIGGATVRQICVDIYNKAQDYTNIFFARSSNPRLKAVYSEIKELDMKVSYPFLLKIHEDFKAHKINETELIQIMQLCINYVLRRYICGLGANSLGQVFANLKLGIKNENYVNSIKNALLSLNGAGRRFPDDNEFIREFNSYKIYNKPRCSYILGMLENFNNENQINPKNFVIKQIIPENFSDIWRHSLGGEWAKIYGKYSETVANLTLLEPNVEFNNQSFSELKNSLASSRLKLNSSICAAYSWTEDSIKRHLENLSNLALSIWPTNGREQNITPQATPLVPLKPHEIAEILDTRIKNLASAGKISSVNIQEYHYDGKQYKITKQRMQRKIAAVIEQQIQVKIYPNINDHEAIIAPELGPVRVAKTLDNGNIKIIIPEQSTEEMIDKAMEVVKQAFEKQTTR